MGSHPSRQRKFSAIADTSPQSLPDFLEVKSEGNARAKVEACLGIYKRLQGYVWRKIPADENDPCYIFRHKDWWILGPEVNSDYAFIGNGNPAFPIQSSGWVYWDGQDWTNEDETLTVKVPSFGDVCTIVPIVKSTNDFEFEPYDIVYCSINKCFYISGFGRIFKMTLDGGTSIIVDGYAPLEGEGIIEGERQTRIGGLAVDPTGEILYVASWGDHCIRCVSLRYGYVRTVAGCPTESGYENGLCASARFTDPLSMAIDEATGDIYVSDVSSIRCISNGIVSALAGSAMCGYEDAKIGAEARFCKPHIAWSNQCRGLYVADEINNCIRRVSRHGEVVTIAGGGGGGSGYGGGQKFHSGEPGFADGRGKEARFYSPNGLALGRDDTIYVADLWNHRIRIVTPGGDVSTLIGTDGYGGLKDGNRRDAEMLYPSDLTICENGCLYVPYMGGSVRQINISARETDGEIGQLRSELLEEQQRKIRLQKLLDLERERVAELKEDIDRSCMMCRERDAVVLFRSCNHIVCCEECAEHKVTGARDMCPACGEKVISKHKVFIP